MENQQHPVPSRMSPLLMTVLVTGLGLLLGAGAVWVWLRARGPTDSTSAIDAGAMPAFDAGPPLSIDDGDGLFHRLSTAWADGGVAWLDQASLRHLVAAAQLVADGESPRPALPFLAISGPFGAREELVAGRPSRHFITPASYARFDTLVGNVGALDAAAAGDAWAALHPYCLVAFAEIGRPGTRFDDVVRSALGQLLAVPVLEGEVALVDKGPLYAFEDPALEGLTAAQKHLLRMGPRHTRTLQRQLRLFGQHAGLLN